MKKTFMVLSMLFCSGCVFTIDQPPPNADKTWVRFETPLEVVRLDMKSCGFDNFFNNVNMPKNTYIISGRCMEKKGYVNSILQQQNKKICDRYAEYQACGGSRID